MKSLLHFNYATNKHQHIDKIRENLGYKSSDKVNETDDFSLSAVEMNDAIDYLTGLLNKQQLQYQQQGIEQEAPTSLYKLVLQKLSTKYHS